MGVERYRNAGTKAAAFHVINAPGYFQFWVKVEDHSTNSRIHPVISLNSVSRNSYVEVGTSRTLLLHSNIGIRGVLARPYDVRTTNDFFLLVQITFKLETWPLQWRSRALTGCSIMRVTTALWRACLSEPEYLFWTPRYIITFLTGEILLWSFS